MISNEDALDAYSAVVVRVAAEVGPSIASVAVRTRRGMGAGSASVITDDGFLLTSSHVVGSTDAGRGHLCRRIAVPGRCGGA